MKLSNPESQAQLWFDSLSSTEKARIMEFLSFSLSGEEFEKFRSIRRYLGHWQFLSKKHAYWIRERWLNIGNFQTR